jgi:hypothetical protein
MRQIASPDIGCEHQYLHRHGGIRPRFILSLKAQCEVRYRKQRSAKAGKCECIR